MSHNKHTFFTSNYNYIQLIKKYSHNSKKNISDFDKANRLVERIKALSFPISLIGKNRRY
jgi:primosomal protein DnaI